MLKKSLSPNSSSIHYKDDNKEGVVSWEFLSPNETLVYFNEDDDNEDGGE